MSYLRLLLSVDRPSDFFRGYRFVTTLARRDNAQVARFRADLAALTTEKATLEQRTRESIALRSRLTAARRNLDAERARKTELLTSLVERKETERRLRGGAGPGRDAPPAAARRPRGSRGRGAPGRLPGQPALAGRGRVRAGFGRRKHPRFDTYTVQNGLEIEAAPEAEVRAVHEGRVVFADRFRGYGLMVVVDHGAQAPLALRAARGDRGRRRGRTWPRGRCWGRPTRGARTGPGSTSRCASRAGPKTPWTGCDRP